MHVTWIEIVELGLLPLGLLIGYAGGRICRRDERMSFDPFMVSHPGLAPEYPRRGDPSATPETRVPSGRRPNRREH